VRWDEELANAVNVSDLDAPPDPQARFAALEAPFNDGKLIAAMQNDFEEWIFRQAEVKVRTNETLKLYAGPQVTQAEFLTSALRSPGMRETPKSAR